MLIYVLLPELQLAGNGLTGHIWDTPPRPERVKRINRYLQSIGVYESVDEIEAAYTCNPNGKLNVEKKTEDYL